MFLEILIIISLLVSCKPLSISMNSGQFKSLKILIHGTKNAYTTVRTFDVVLYKLDSPIISMHPRYLTPINQTKSLAVYSEDEDLIPLCNFEKGSNEYFTDKFRPNLNPDALSRDKRILRVVSSDRRGTDCFIVDEYIDDDVHVPVRDKNDVSTPPLSIDDHQEGFNYFNELELEIENLESALKGFKSKFSELKSKYTLIPKSES